MHGRGDAVRLLHGAGAGTCGATACPGCCSSQERTRATAKGWSIDRVDDKKFACYGFFDGFCAGGARNAMPCTTDDTNTTTGCPGNAQCTAAGMPFVCCTGAGTGTCGTTRCPGCCIPKVTQKTIKTPKKPSKNFTDSVDGWNKAAMQGGNPNQGKIKIPPLTTP
jgi:hypothetical protein